MSHTTRFLAFACIALLLPLGGCQSQRPASQSRGPTPVAQQVEPAPTAQPAQPSGSVSVTVFPVVLGEAPNEDVATVVGTLLERGGLPQVEVATAAYVPDRTLEVEKQASAFGTFVARRGLTTDYALFGAFLGSPRTGVAEIRGAVVDRNGGVVWVERQRPGEPAFDQAKPDCPMDCCVLLVERLRPLWNLADPTRSDAPEGKLAARMQAKAGIPPQAELDAIHARLATLRAAGPKTAVRVYPARVGADWSADGASRVAAILNERGLLRATAVEKPIAFAVTPSSNEQAMLWSGAKAIQAAVRAAGKQTDYSLFTDFLMAPDGKAGAVHTYLLSPDGELVIVDFQNSHHEDFARVAPASIAGCADLSAARIASNLR